jgi:hypothetical protein
MTIGHSHISFFIHSRRHQLPCWEDAQQPHIEDFMDRNPIAKWLSHFEGKSANSQPLSLSAEASNITEQRQAYWLCSVSSEIINDYCFFRPIHFGVTCYAANIVVVHCIQFMYLKKPRRHLCLSSDGLLGSSCSTQTSGKQAAGPLCLLPRS